MGRTEPSRRLAGGSAQEVVEPSRACVHRRDTVNTDAFGPYLELMDELLRGSLAGTNAQKMARRAFAPVTPVTERALEVARNLGAQAAKAFSSRARAGG
jgi:hypothetical protein